MYSSFDEAVNLMQNIQKKTLNELDKVAKLDKNQDKWSYQSGEGGGLTIVCNSDDKIDQASINFSNIAGANLIPSATLEKPELKEASFKATGVSIIIHPKNPYIPTTHANFRLFQAKKSCGNIIWWFGGGFDLTPYYPFVEDCKLWHKNIFHVCNKYNKDLYNEFKNNCDDYFYLPHRNEPRGIGGIFFDNLNRWNFDVCLSFIEDASNTFIKTYIGMFVSRDKEPYSDLEEAFKLYRRSRYVEFNLLYDRGTKFGIESKGRINSIFASLPPVVHWHYKNKSSFEKQEQILLEFLNTKDWLI